VKVPTRIVRVGTRGSRLALAQTSTVIDDLRHTSPSRDFEVVEISTTGDRRPEVPLGEGIFVKEIQRALLAGEIDLAVHSLKDLPTQEVEALSIAAVTRREDPREALVGGTLQTLSKGARVGTGSPRRSAALRRLRDDLEVVAIRGNVPTRVEKARSGELDAVLVAHAGLLRLGIVADDVIDALKILPAPGQGALAVEVRSGNGTMIEIASAIDHPGSRAAAIAERAVLRELGGGCLLPLGAYGRMEADDLLLDAGVVEAGGLREVRASARGPAGEWRELGASVALDLERRGALDLL
jgi:hydroxymethylbilane synthase